MQKMMTLKYQGDIKVFIQSFYCFFFFPNRGASWLHQRRTIYLHHHRSTFCYWWCFVKCWTEVVLISKKSRVDNFPLKPKEIESPRPTKRPLCYLYSIFRQTSPKKIRSSPTQILINKLKHKSLMPKKVIKCT